MPRDPDNINRVQVQVATDIGGINTRMLLDASSEIEKYHFGPLQVALCLLYAVLEEYSRLTKTTIVFCNGNMDTFLQRNDHVLQSLKGLRHSILHERYDNIDVQRQFVSPHVGDSIRLVIEGEQTFQSYLKLLEDRLRGDE